MDLALDSLHSLDGSGLYWPLEDSWEAGPASLTTERTNNGNFRGEIYWSLFLTVMMSNLNVQVNDNASWAIAFELLSPGRKKSVGQFNILQYLDNFLPINFPDNDPANGTVSMSPDDGRHWAASSTIIKFLRRLQACKTLNQYLWSLHLHFPIR